MGNVGLIGSCIALGWLLGVPLCLAARQLGSKQGSESPPISLALLAVDPPLQAFQALTLAALAARFGPSLQLAIYGALSLILTVVFFVDLRTRYVYGIVAYPGILAGVVLTPLAQGGAFWESLASAILGAMVFGAFYFFGRLLYRGRVPLAGGDVIIAALVGSIVGIGQLAPAIFLGTVFSALLAIAVASRRRSLRVYLPYGPGLCLGALVALLR
jgi:leader peptidase (prepilin peptidase) / N-methyltransferase